MSKSLLSNPLLHFIFSLSSCLHFKLPLLFFPSSDLAHCPLCVGLISSSFSPVLSLPFFLTCSTISLSDFHSSLFSLCSVSSHVFPLSSLRFLLFVNLYFHCQPSPSPPSLSPLYPLLASHFFNFLIIFVPIHFFPFLCPLLSTFTLFLS